MRNLSRASIICQAIQSHSLLEFRYHGLPRVVQPYCHGISTRGVEVLRAVQVGGASNSRNFGFGKLWTVADILAARVLDGTFVPDDPDYNPDDSAMVQIHCRI